MDHPGVRRQLTRRRFQAITGGAVAAAIVAIGHRGSAAAAVAQPSRDYVSLVNPFWVRLVLRD